MQKPMMTRVPSPPGPLQSRSPPSNTRALKPVGSARLFRGDERSSVLRVIHNSWALSSLTVIVSVHILRILALQDVVFSSSVPIRKSPDFLGYTHTPSLSLLLLRGRTSGKRPRHAAALLPQGLQDSVGIRQAVRDSVVVLDK
jgi:hypothetical protein